MVRQRDRQIWDREIRQSIPFPLFFLSIIEPNTRVAPSALPLPPRKRNRLEPEEERNKDRQRASACDLVDGISSEQQQKRTDKKKVREDGMEVARDGNGGEMGREDG
ncbi:unnamed protein product [Linum trigynum]|uniref:Uncharacterized protein n=1 Tax=Linum trigynum TaxID=586398 RepID=A0AAV2FKC3_9ROSI